MAIKAYKPTTPARRGMTSQDFVTITAKRSKRSLIASKDRTNGRNNQGRITTRHRGGGARRFYRQVNFKLPVGVKATVEQVEYDPNRSAHIALIKDNEDNYSYVLAGKGMKPGKKIASGEDVAVTDGSRLPLKNIPAGSSIYAVELQPGKGAQIARSAGTSVQLMGKEGKYAQLRMPSGEIRLVNLNSMANVGSVGNEQHQNIKIGKAGRTRHKGFRPTVRGSVMAAADHPHGGGDGGRHGTGKDPRTPWGQKTLGYKTRRRKYTNQFIVKSRQAAKRR